jgi:hypothetical protein
MTQQWQPIESAPKDGTVFLTWRKGWLRARMCMMNSGRWFYPFGAPVSDLESDQPTHWMPIPPPPTD